MYIHQLIRAWARIGASVVVVLGVCGAGQAGTLLRTGGALPGSLKPAPNLTLPAPKLAIVNASAALQRHCRSPQPLFVVSAAVRNTGGPLAANRGHIYASEDSGVTDGHKRLVSAGIPLPAIGRNTSAVVKIPVQSLAPYSELSGAHSLTVHIVATSYSGKPAFANPRTYTFRVRVPGGFCLSRPTSPSVRVRPAPSLKLNPQPEPPAPAR
ncbi:MAG: hypothetical protein P8009_06440 [Gammaproteobacteria bacterium]